MSGTSSPPSMPLAVSPQWRNDQDPWPSDVCKECGETFQGSPTQVWCSDVCRRKARTRSNQQGKRARLAAEKLGIDYVPYETIGRYELLQAFGDRCGKCGNPLAPEEVWVAHLIGVEHGGQHVRENVAPVHRECEAEWNEEQRTAR